jgi:glutaminyl-peptide cyclotransferase
VGSIRIAAIAAAILALLYPAGASVEASAPVYGYEVVHVYPHDDGAFTQGLIFGNGFFYEGTGLYGESSLRKVEVETGIVLKRHDLPEEYFGEGITALRDTIYQLTWKDSLGFAYTEGDTFELIETFPYSWHGWGLTHDGTHLIASDGTSTIRFLDPGTRDEVYQIQVHDDGEPVAFLNELEYIQGRIYSNIIYLDRIAVIEPSSGVVEAWLDLGGLRDSVSSHPSADALNGIAFEPEETRLFVTGKRWPKLFEIDVVLLHPSGTEEIASTPVLRTFPNPCRRRTHLTFRVPQESPVSLRIFDIQGRLVRTLVDGGRGVGEHAVALDVGGLSSGTYIVRLVSGEMMETVKILVVD